MALGRKNALFAESDSWACQWAIVASLVTTAQLNGVEPCWSKLKQWLRAKAARSLEVLETELGQPLPQSPPRTPRDGFACGYVTPN